MFRYVITVMFFFLTTLLAMASYKLAQLGVDQWGWFLFTAIWSGIATVGLAAGAEE